MSQVEELRNKYIKELSDVIAKSEYTKNPEMLISQLEHLLGKEVSTTFSKELQAIIKETMKNDPNGLKIHLERIYGKGATFREGQEEAIISVLQGKKTLVLQRTGWGKSLVYFLSSLILSKKSNAPVIIVSPLLALINNQMESAKKFGLRVNTLTSANKNEWSEIYYDIEKGRLDILFISPERLANKEFRDFITRFIDRIPLFVVDESHCISDWGHDFRPDFRRIVKFIHELSSSTPILATTATANERVLRDIKSQLGEDLEITRGSMDRPSIDIDIRDFATKEDKLTWLKNNIHTFKGNGIIYCLTIKDCELVKTHLEKYKNNIGVVEVYHAQLTSEEKADIEKRFQANQIKVLVCTIAFGMGVDKPDIAFVIHFQQPASIIAYYQQIGRAGRGIPHSKAVMLASVKDNEINTFFIDNAFPPQELVETIIDEIQSSPNGVNYNQLLIAVNQKGNGRKYWDNAHFELALKNLDVDGQIEYRGGLLFKTNKEWTGDNTRNNIVTLFKRKELLQFNEYIRTDGCYLKFLRNELGDINVQPCGHCSNCVRRGIRPPKIDARKAASDIEPLDIFKGKCYVGRIVSHKAFGGGKITQVDDEYVYVSFDNGKESCFNYEMAPRFITLL